MYALACNGMHAFVSVPYEIQQLYIQEELLGSDILVCLHTLTVFGQIKANLGHGDILQHIQ